MWFRESNRYFRNIENFAYGEISERSFSNPHPWSILSIYFRIISLILEQLYDYPNSSVGILKDVGKPLIRI